MIPPPPPSTLFPYTTLFRSSPKELNHFSMLDHLRHLLVQAPELKVLGLPGGMSIWLLRNAEEILRWSVEAEEDRKSTRLNSSHVAISYAVFCLKKKNKQTRG